MAAISGFADNADKEAVVSGVRLALGPQAKSNDRQLVLMISSFFRKSGKREAERTTD